MSNIIINREFQHKVNTRNPWDIIDFINTEYPDLKGLCYYDEKELKTRDSQKAFFYFDPYHSVVQVTIIDHELQEKA